MALIKACIVGNSVKNTGKECDIAMGPAAMLIAVPPSTVISAANLLDPIAWIRPLMHADKQSRVYPLFGSVAPINVINDNAEGDVTVTLDDGTKILVRLGVYNRTYETIAGGLCYAEALLSFISSGYRVIEIDQQGKMLLRKNIGLPKTWSGLITTYMGGMAPQLATLKDVFRNRFNYSFTPQELVNSGEIFEGAGSLLGLMGLIDAELLDGDGVQSTTHLFIKVQTHCAESDLVDLIGVDLADATNFIITNKATGAVITPSGVAITAGEIDFTGVFATGQTFNVIGSAPSVWYGNDILGYDASENGVDITIP